MDVNGTYFDIAVMAPNTVQKALTREHMAWIFEEMLEQAVFGWPKRNLLSAALYLMRDRIHFDIAKAQCLASERGADPAQDGLCTGDQFAR